MKTIGEYIKSSRKDFYKQTLEQASKHINVKGLNRKVLSKIEKNELKVTKREWLLALDNYNLYAIRMKDKPVKNEFEKAINTKTMALVNIKQKVLNQKKREFDKFLDIYCMNDDVLLIQRLWIYKYDFNGSYTREPVGVMVAMRESYGAINIGVSFCKEGDLFKHKVGRSYAIYNALNQPNKVTIKDKIYVVHKSLEVQFLRFVKKVVLRLGKENVISIPNIRFIPI
jgi:hypothetical protein